MSLRKALGQAEMYDIDRLLVLVRGSCLCVLTLASVTTRFLRPRSALRGWALSHGDATRREIAGNEDSSHTSTHRPWELHTKQITLHYTIAGNTRYPSPNLNVLNFFPYMLASFIELENEVGPHRILSMHLKKTGIDSRVLKCKAEMSTSSFPNLDQLISELSSLVLFVFYVLSEKLYLLTNSHLRK